MTNSRSEARAREVYAQELDRDMPHGSQMAALIRSGRPLDPKGIHVAALRAIQTAFTEPAAAMPGVPEREDLRIDPLGLIELAEQCSRSDCASAIELGEYILAMSLDMPAAKLRARKAITDRYYAGGKVVQMTPVKPAELVDLVFDASMPNLLQSLSPSHSGETGEVEEPECPRHGNPGQYIGSCCIEADGKRGNIGHATGCVKINCAGCGADFYSADHSSAAKLRIAREELRALAALIERPPLDDVLLEKVVAIRAAESIRTVLATPNDGGRGDASNAHN